MNQRPRSGGPSGYASSSSRGRGAYHTSGPSSYPNRPPSAHSRGPRPPRQRSPSPPPKVKRSTTVPSLLRVFVSRTPQHHDDALFSSPDGTGPARSILQDEYQLYVWRDSTLKELVHALASSFPLPTTPPNIRYSFKLVYYDAQSSRHRSKPIGSLTNRDIFHSTKSTTGTAPGDKTLHQTSWVVGDYLSIALQPTFNAGGAPSFGANKPQNAYPNRGPPSSSGFQLRGAPTRGPAGDRFNAGALATPSFGIRGTATSRASANDDRWASNLNDSRPPPSSGPSGFGFGDSNRAMAQERWKTNSEMSASAREGTQDAHSAPRRRLSISSKRSRSRSPGPRSPPRKEGKGGDTWEKGTEWDTKKASSPQRTSKREEDSPMRDGRRDE
ncbi:BZ3500_MvSof-1268-A1-R1_Chr5-2g07860 [Microbotryum saponariae]|uniref:BZ3500_MvSof-1268-A1-R1_Chr5-2g07860 protein n=1 Tax=Microbotryum saponariae TaxID=289078 RepID=A0A2X0KFY6_9BASI|nr:BZ3500_MvSof-1268-A1-R1_Chr5-2g07860 [Microbotryum saponariae]SDA05729.1 BZ3501_MvSof-1269-A2-R1_Chr5-2g07682 [Microbotryum saponariae]